MLIQQWSPQYQIIVLQVDHVEISIVVNALVLESDLHTKIYFGPQALDLKPWTANWMVSGFSNGKRFTRSCSASVNDIKSASEPVSISAFAGCPSIWTMAPQDEGSSV